MANTVGAFIRRGTAGPLTAGPDAGDMVFVVLQANRGPVNVPTLVTSPGRFTAAFGGPTTFSDGKRYSTGHELVQLLFTKGVRKITVLRVVGDSATLGGVELMDGETVPAACLLVNGKGEGSWVEDYEVHISEGTRADTFKLSIYTAGGEAAGDEPIEVHDNLTMAGDDLARVSDASDLVTLDGLSANIPANGTFLLNATTPGVDDNEPEAAEIVGTDVDGVKTGLKCLRRRSLGRGFVMAPDLDHDDLVRDELRLQTEAFFRVYMASGPAGLTPAAAITDAHKVRAFNVAYHYPRLQVVDAYTKERKTVPASAHVVADWLRVIGTKGPAKAPAGRDFRLDFVRGLEARSNGEALVDEGVAELLVANGVNPLWDRDGTGPKVWGARSTSDDPAWIYLHDAYLWCLISSNMQAMLDRETYESDNNGLLFSRINGGMRLFMLDLHNQGAFYGKAPLEGEDPSEEHAFATRCDADMLTAQDKNTGILRAEIWFKSALTAETILCTVAKRVNE
ncbi:MAG: hypothetical protein ACF8MF_06825 [Phycisphaerales bacterium JB052]